MKERFHKFFRGESEADILVCPRCGALLIDNPKEKIASLPSKVGTICPKCGQRGFRKVRDSL